MNDKIDFKAKDKLVEIDFNSKNYFALASSRCDKLINYIDDNVNEYIENVYLKLITNTEEDEGCLINLLNDDQLLDESKFKLIKQQKTKVENLSSITDLEVSKVLLEESKVIPF